MAHHVDKTGFPNIPLTAGMKIRLEARSPTTEAAVTGVTSSLWSIYGSDLSEAATEPLVPPYSLDVDEGSV